MRIGPSLQKRKRIVVADVVSAPDAVVVAHAGVAVCHPVSASAPIVTEEQEEADAVDAPFAKSPLLRMETESPVFPPSHSIP